MRSLNRFILFVMFVLALSFSWTTVGLGEADWSQIARGIEYSSYGMEGGGRIHAVRIDPDRSQLRLLLASEHDRKLRTAGSWCDDFHLSVAINAGMYQKDYLTHTGYLRSGSHMQNRHWNRKYQAVLAFDPKKAGLPAAILVDLDEAGAAERLKDYRAVVQNLRLMKGEGTGVWGKSEKKWSEAAVGIDRGGRILFLFCRFPLTMREFNERIGSLGLGVVRMMHMEGGAVASLSVRTRNVRLDLAGNYGPASEDDLGALQQPIPNVLGVLPR